MGLFAAAAAAALMRTRYRWAVFLVVALSIQGLAWYWNGDANWEALPLIVLPVTLLLLIAAGASLRST